MKPDLIEKYYKSPADNFGGEMNGRAAGTLQRFAANNKKRAYPTAAKMP